MSLDATIQTLFDKLNTRKNTLSTLKAASAKTWKTNCAFRIGWSTSTTNLQTASAQTIEDCAWYLCMVQSARQVALTRLNRPDNDKFNGYSINNWFSDFEKRLATIAYRDEEVEIEVLEHRLNQVLSPDERRRIEVELLAKEI
jgi:hypothetical protein